MRQTRQLLHALQSELRKRQLTYKDLAERIHMSEASIKRMFSTQSLTVERLETLCDAIQISLADLIRIADQSSPPMMMLEEAQETQLVRDENLLLMANCVLNGLSLEDVVALYRISLHEGVRLLARLDTLGLIELLPQNRVRLRVARHFRWRPGGEIERLVTQSFEREFLQSTFADAGQMKSFASAMLSRESNALVQRQARKLVGLVAELHEADSHLPRDQTFGSSLLLAFRPWEPKVFSKKRRKPDIRRF